MSFTQRGNAVVVQPDEGVSHWQPMPANGYAEVRLSREGTPGISEFSSGIQVIAPGGFVREHQHGDRDEILFFYEGTGIALVDDQEHPIRPGTTIFVGPRRRHKFTNTGTTDLKMFWVLLPGGLEDFFAGIGRLRQAGEPAPNPFARPDDASQVEANTVFVPLDN